ncbi:MAG: RNA polymerase sigma factor, partial [Nitrospinota bacterium]
MNDTELVRQSISGSEEAFENLLNRHYGMIFRVAYKWCGIKEDAEDIAQEVCIKLGESIRGFKFEAAFSSWLYRVTMNSAKDYYRSRNRKRLNERAFEQTQM